MQGRANGEKKVIETRHHITATHALVFAAIKSNLSVSLGVRISSDIIPNP
jgi:hypothetical protein